MHQIRRWTSRIALCFIAMVLTHSFTLPGAQNETPGFHSRILGEEIPLLIHVPDNGGGISRSFPLLIVLDGYVHFPYVASTVDYLAARNMIPPMVVVGVHSRNRVRDFLPSSANEGQTGRNERFAQMISQELIPWMERNHHASRVRFLFGHSFGGFFTLDTLLKDPGLFAGFHAVSPSVYSAEFRLVRDLNDLIKANRLPKTHLFFSVGGKERKQMVKANRQLSRILDQTSGTGLRHRFLFLPEDDHDTGQLKTLYEGLLFFYHGYIFKTQQSGCLPPQGIGPVAAKLSDIKQYYASLSRQKGFQIGIPGHALIGCAYALLSEEISDIAGALEIMAYAAQQNPYNVKVLYHCGRIFSLCKKPSMARSYFLAARKLLEEFRDLGLFWIEDAIGKELDSHQLSSE